MSDFMDFLKHKYAYIALGEFKPGKFTEAKELYEKAVATYNEGFKGAYLLQLPGTEKGIAVIFWEGVENMDANQSDTYKAALAEMSHLFAKPPETNFYQIVTEILPE